MEATYRTVRRLSNKRAIVALKGIVAIPPRNNRPTGDRHERRAVTTDLRNGRALIDFGNRPERLTSVQVEVGLRDVFVRHVTVTFGNGDLKRFDVGQWVDEGRRTPRLTFQDGPRRVREVAIVTRPSRSADIARFVLHTTRLNDSYRSDDRRDRDNANNSDDRFGPVPALDRGGAPRNHILLGTLDVVLGKPSLELNVNRSIGPIVSLALRAGGRDVGVGTIVTTYANGDTDRIQVLRQLRRNNVSPRIRLKRTGKIRRIRVKATALTTQNTRLRVYAMLAQPDRQRDRDVRPAAGQWINLAYTRPPRFKSKTDVITVGRTKGRLEAFRIRVEKHDVRFKGIRVVFGNGSEQEFPFYDKVNDGVTTSRFVLAPSGRGRFVQRIIMRYNTTANFKGTALVVLEGFKR